MASSPSPLDSTPPPGPPSAVPLPLPAPPSSRRLPPPCWSHDETVALIDAYRDKWYSLGRGNLKATHWQEVADAVTQRCPNASPAKTAVQCRHKMEKLRKRYRTEIQRARSLPVSRFNSSWVHFKRMDFMEKGPSAVKHENNSDSPDDNEDDDGEPDQDLYAEFKNGGGSNTRSLNKLYRNGVGGSGSGGSGGGGGFRIRIPTGVSIAQPGSKYYGKIPDQKFNPHSNPNPNSDFAPNFGARLFKERSGLAKKERERDPMGEMVSAIKVLGDGFVRMEQMKMEMAREIESMRMEMEMKRTEMILESQQRIVEAFAKAVSEKKKKKAKRMSSPPES
ncbi:Trihelix transcription factor [Quillaja saponaria]|uniref:Trihelix transcription factor n=1 Tax=Quillaja saponaria TaxID=32244 RepID=A0AAD7LQ06_QUISA|nr:Trihelix transcription factor [Quillaja saponaria]